MAKEKTYKILWNRDRGNQGFDLKDSYGAAGYAPRPLTRIMEREVLKKIKTGDKSLKIIHLTKEEHQNWIETGEAPVHVTVNDARKKKFEAKEEGKDVSGIVDKVVDLSDLGYNFSLNLSNLSEPVTREMGMADLRVMAKQAGWPESEEMPKGQTGRKIL